MTQRTTLTRFTAASATAAIALLGVSACSSGASKPQANHVATVTGPKVDVAAAKVHFQLPKGWVDVPFDSTTSSTLQKAVHDNTTANELFGEIQRGQTQGLKAFAVDPATGSAPAKLDFAVVPATGTTIDGLGKLLDVQFTRLSVSNEKLDKITVPAGQMLRATYDLPTKQHVVQYYLIANQISYGLTFTMPHANTVSRDMLDAVASSFRLG